MCVSLSRLLGLSLALSLALSLSRSLSRALSLCLCLSLAREREMFTRERQMFTSLSKPHSCFFSCICPLLLCVCLFLSLSVALSVSLFFPLPLSRALFLVLSPSLPPVHSLSRTLSLALSRSLASPTRNIYNPSYLNRASVAVRCCSVLHQQVPVIPPAPMNHVKYLRAGPAEMPFQICTGR